MNEDLLYIKILKEDMIYIFIYLDIITHMDGTTYFLFINEVDKTEVRLNAFEFIQCSVDDYRRQQINKI